MYALVVAALGVTLATTMGQFGLLAILVTTGHQPAEMPARHAKQLPGLIRNLADNSRATERG